MKNMGYFNQWRSRQSRFYQRLWQEISEIKVIDTHEHLRNTNGLIQETGMDLATKNPFRLPDIFRGSYVYDLDHKGNYQTWAKYLQKYRGTGYLKSWLISMEDLYELEGPITPKYLELMEERINDAYREDFQARKHSHLSEILREKMNVVHVINNIELDDHLEMPRPLIQAAAGVRSIFEGYNVPRSGSSTSNVAFQYARDHLNKDWGELKTLDDYIEVIEKLLKYFRDSGNYICYKSQFAYTRPLWFPEPPDNDDEIAILFNTKRQTQEEQWKIGDYLFHRVLEWAATEWNVPFQLHTGLGRMFDGGSDALNLSHVFEKFADVHFDLFHGNYPYDKLAGMMHQIPNISADLCWLPAISPTAATKTLIECFETGTMTHDYPENLPSLRTSLFGGDSRIVEGSYGALQLAKDVLIRALEHLYENGTIFEADAIDLAENVLYNNPKRIFF